MGLTQATKYGGLLALVFFMGSAHATSCNNGSGPWNGQTPSCPAGEEFIGWTYDTSTSTGGHQPSGVHSDLESLCQANWNNSNTDFFEHWSVFFDGGGNPIECRIHRDKFSSGDCSGSSQGRAIAPACGAPNPCAGLENTDPFFLSFARGGTLPTGVGECAVQKTGPIISCINDPTAAPEHIGEGGLTCRSEFTFTGQPGGGDDGGTPEDPDADGCVTDSQGNKTCFEPDNSGCGLANGQPRCADDKPPTGCITHQGKEICPDFNATGVGVVEGQAINGPDQPGCGEVDGEIHCTGDATPADGVPDADGDGTGDDPESTAEVGQGGLGGTTNTTTINNSGPAGGGDGGDGGGGDGGNGDGGDGEGNGPGCLEDASECADYTPPEANGELDVDGLDQQIADARGELNTTISTIRAEATQLFGHWQAGGAGELPCIDADASFVQVNFCVQDHAGVLSLVRNFLLALAFIAAFFIVLSAISRQDQD